MDTISILVTVLSSIISGILATWISNRYYNKMLIQERKTKFVQDFFGYRYQLGDFNKYGGKELTETLSQIPIVFNKNEEVISHYTDILNNGSSNEKFINLIKEMCKDKDIRIDISNWNDSMLMKTLKL